MDLLTLGKWLQKDHGSPSFICYLICNNILHKLFSFRGSLFQIWNLSSVVIGHMSHRVAYLPVDWMSTALMIKFVHLEPSLASWSWWNLCYRLQRTWDRVPKIWISQAVILKHAIHIVRHLQSEASPTSNKAPQSAGWAEWWSKSITFQIDSLCHLAG